MSLNFRHHCRGTAVPSGPRGKLARLNRFARRKDRGGMAVLCAVMVPTLVGFGTLAINQGYCGYRNLLLRQTVQSSALAAGNALKTYYSSGSSSAVVTAAQTFATANMPTGTYGTVVPSSNVVLGNWSGGSFTSLASSHGTTPNAVQVTGVNSAANGNAISLFLGSVFGKTSLDLSTTAIAVNTSGKTFNAIVLNDMSQSFSGELSNVQTADTAILNCVKGQSGTSSKFGITLINGHATTYQALTQASSNLTSLLTSITTLTGLSCLLNCSTGSNVASGIYSAIQQYSGSTYNGTSKNIVIITDGVPNYKSGVVMSPSDGVTCTTHCTDALLLTGAQTQAAAASAAGINISTIYYSGNTPGDQQASYAASVASLVTGTGVALVAPTTASINNAYAAFCSTIPSSLKAVM